MPRFHVTSDTHFGHRRIFEEGYCPNRQRWMEAPTIDAHDEALIAMWNAIVHPDDTVIHCGDFAFGSAKTVMQYRLRLNGALWMVLGNHDRGLKSMRNCCVLTPRDAVGHGLRLRMAIGSAEFRVTVRHMPLVGASEPPGLCFSPEDEAASDFLWHGHIHDRFHGASYVPPTPKHVAWGIDTHPEHPITILPCHMRLEAVL
jgi:calcineurin-like phosphoesterase family protein